MLIESKHGIFWLKAILLPKNAMLMIINTSNALNVISVSYTLKSLPRFLYITWLNILKRIINLKKLWCSCKMFTEVDYITN